MTRRPGRVPWTDEHSAVEPVGRTDSLFMVVVVVLSAGAAAASLVATGLMVVGLTTGDALDSPAAMIGCGVLLTLGFSGGAYRAGTVARWRGAPEPAGEPPVLAVRNRMGIVFWVWATVAVIGCFATGSAVVTMLRRWRGGDHRGLEDVSGLAGVGCVLMLILFTVGAASLAMMLPGRMLRAHRHTQLWVSREGIGYPPETAEDPGFLRWAQVAAVSHDVHDVRGLVYSHVWTITGTDGERRTVLYPAGASPRPREVCRTIRDVAPAVEVSR